MKSFIKFTTFIVLIFLTQLSFANSILGSYTPTYQDFKFTYPTSVSNVIAIPNSNFLIFGNSVCGNQKLCILLATTPDSEQGGTITITVSVGTTYPTCNGSFTMPLTIDAKGNIETSNTSYPININGCNVSTLTGTVTGNPDSTSSYKITIH